MTIGVLGAGQLGRMLALAGYSLGHTFKFFDSSPDAPASDLAELVTGSYDDTNLLALFAEGLDVITFEFENIPARTAQTVSSIVPVYPPPRALEISQDRVAEKEFFRSLGIPTPAFVQIHSREDPAAAIDSVTTPCILKTRTSGYDGKGQFVLQSKADAGRAWDHVKGRHSILEAFVPFERELSLIAVRSMSNQTAFYPLTENMHRDGILRTSFSPAQGVSEKLAIQAQGYATRILDALHYVGVMAIELFQTGDQLLANEMAPRVHNSGHWTIEGAETSQFENHIRAITGMPLGSTASRGYSAMINIIGDIPDVQKILQVTGAHLHLYGKNPRPNRKLGHVTVRADELEDLQNKIALVKVMIEK